MTQVKKENGSEANSPTIQVKRESRSEPDSPTERVPPTPPPPPPLRLIDIVWVVSGDDCLSSSFESDLKDACASRRWPFVPIALDTEGLVLRSSSGVAGLLRYWDDRSLRRMIEATTGHKLLESAYLSCAVSEHTFRRFPNKSNEEPWRLRLDNVNACLCTFAVDGKSTKMRPSGHNCKCEKLLRPALKKNVFMSIG